jgi:hypothetical protein
MFASCSKDRNIFVCQLGHTQPIRKYLGSPKGAGGHSDEVNAVRWLVTTFFLVSPSEEVGRICTRRAEVPRLGVDVRVGVWVCGCMCVGIHVCGPVAHISRKQSRCEKCAVIFEVTLPCVVHMAPPPPSLTLAANEGYSSQSRLLVARLTVGVVLGMTNLGSNSHWRHRQLETRMPIQ